MAETKRDTGLATAVRMRKSDMRHAARLEGRGWKCEPPKDEIQVKAEGK